MSEMTRPAHNNIGSYNTSQQNRNNWSSNVRPSSNGTPQDIYDHVPPPQSQPTYDKVPCSDYDIVPPPKPLHPNYNQEDAPPINRVVKPQTLKPYVNLQTPIDQGFGTYPKPLPRPPGQTQRDSGTVVDDEGGIYDVPPVPLPPGKCCH